MKKELFFSPSVEVFKFLEEDRIITATAPGTGGNQPPEGEEDAL